ncbi:MAG TPA: hypothetical protein VFG43_10710 [Geminicoccaceae bacterium]|nr:hypothetical protein [Geminicoccaceae bacterium]
MNVVMVPSVSGGIGHLSRTATLARALRRLDPSIHIEYVLDTERLRPFNIDAIMRMGWRPRLLPARGPDNRGPIVRACFGDADVIVDDVARYLLPLRHHIPQAAWISIAMHPIGDELFLDWPLMVQMDAVIWAYPPAAGLPDELAIVKDKLVQTGPFLDLEGVPDKAAARARLGLTPEEPMVLYAPRGFPFGEEFGHRVLASVYGAVDALRRTGYPKLRLVLLTVDDPAELRRVKGIPSELPGWVTARGVVPPPEALVHEQAADILIAEGTSTIHEGAALRTPLVIIPGPLQEILRLANAMADGQAAQVFANESVTADTLASAFATILARAERREAMIEGAHALVTGGGGVAAAARLVLDVAARRNAAQARRGHGKGG